MEQEGAHEPQTVPAVASRRAARAPIAAQVRGRRCLPCSGQPAMRRWLERFAPGRPASRFGPGRRRPCRCSARRPATSAFIAGRRSMRAGRTRPERARRDRREPTFAIGSNAPALDTPGGPTAARARGRARPPAGEAGNRDGDGSRGGPGRRRGRGGDARPAVRDVSPRRTGRSTSRPRSTRRPSRPRWRSRGSRTRSRWPRTSETGAETSRRSSSHRWTRSSATTRRSRSST